MVGLRIRNLDQWRTKCYGVDWSRAIHTGEDWYRDNYLTANTAGTPVYVVADGVVAQHNPGISYPGNVVLIRHRLANGRNLYSMYGHVANVTVVIGQQVKRGQQIATVLNQGYVGRTPAKHPTWDSHLHFEMRYIEHAGNIYTSGRNAYGYNYPGCTYAYPGRGYTYIVHPDAYPYPNAGYTDPSDFIAANLEGPPGGCVPQELLRNGNFELGRTAWGAVNSAGANDPLIYTTRPRTGRWSGWLGNRANYTDTLSQGVQVPANSNVLRLSFWRYVQSKEAAGNADDKMTLRLSNPDGQPIATQEVATSAAARHVWQQFTTEFNLAGYAFSTASLSLTGANDADLVSSFFVDDASLQTVCAASMADTTTDMGRGDPSASSGLLRPYENRTDTKLMPTSEQTPTVFLPLVITDVDRGPDQPEKDMAAPACTNLLVNGGFESPLALPWSGIANTPGAIYNVIPGGANTSLKDTLTDAARAHSGLKSGRVGSPSVNGYWNELVQTAKLPANVTSASLRYWRFLDTRETNVTTSFDRFEVGLESDEGIQLISPQKFDNRDAKRGQWVQETLNLPNPSAYSGQSIWVTVKGSLDNTNPSSFLVDDVELNVCAQP
ncbi:MAG: M23 family metallopeptidase [Anaerolineae bacterium]|nr:M23 family metallopeptidase [Anaerolineae bacterium]